MKKTLLLTSIYITTILNACNSDGTNSKHETTPLNSPINHESGSLKDTSNAVSTTFEAGKGLIATSDCLGCHKEKEKLVGPAYSAIAAKYRATDENINKLSGKIISGGQGNWGNVPMTPHPALSKAQASE